KRGVLERGLAPGQIARLASRLTSPRGRDRLPYDLVRLSGILLEELAQLAVDGRLDEPLHRRIAELRLGLALELRVVQLDRDDRRETFANVLSPKALVLLLQEPLLARIVVQRARQCRTEPGEVRAP